MNRKSQHGTDAVELGTRPALLLLPRLQTVEDKVEISICTRIYSARTDLSPDSDLSEYNQLR